MGFNIRRGRVEIIQDTIREVSCPSDPDHLLSILFQSDAVRRLLPRNLLPEHTRRRGRVALDLRVHIVLDVGVLPAPALVVPRDLAPHLRDVLVDLGRDTIDGGLRERHAGAVRLEVRSATRGALEPATSHHDGYGALLYEVVGGRA